LLASDILPFEICQCAPARKLNPSSSARKRMKNAIFVRSDKIRKRKERKPITSRKKAKLELKPTVSRPELGSVPLVAYAPQALKDG